MKAHTLGEAYHIEKTIADRQGIAQYPCGCTRCHGSKLHQAETIARHHRK
jgi:hypothetical protein